jgi:hypothetical protein
MLNKVGKCGPYDVEYYEVGRYERLFLEALVGVNQNPYLFPPW